MLALGTCALGRAIDAFGEPLDGERGLRGRRVPLIARVPAPNQRAPIAQTFWTRVRVIDGLLAIGRGARIGVFGAPGSGKSSLLESIVTGCEADAIVVALIGERGREARTWIDRRDERTTVVCATSDRSAHERIRAARVALAHAHALREHGLHVVLLLDSLARVAAALRERQIGAGEACGRGGYPPSVFSELAGMVELTGATVDGSITLIASVLSDGDDRDPVSEAARSLLDGHITLSERLVRDGRFPAIDVAASVSRTMTLVVNADHARHARQVRGAIARLDGIADARALGLEPGDAATLRLIAAEPQLESFLRQSAPTRPLETLAALAELADTLEEPHGYQ